MYFTFKEMLKSHMPKTFIELNEIGALDEKYLSMMFIDFFVELLPTKLLLPMLDAYLLEGVKVLYRYGIALITGYKTSIKSHEYHSAKEFWLSIKSDSFTASNFNPLICKLLNMEEVLPMVDQFVVFEHSANTQEFLSSSIAIRSLAYDLDRSLLAKTIKPLPISRSSLDNLEKVAVLQAPKDLPSQRKSMMYSSSSPFNSNGSGSGSGNDSPNGNGREMSSIDNVRRHSMLLSLGKTSPLSVTGSVGYSPTNTGPLTPPGTSGTIGSNRPHSFHRSYTTGSMNMTNTNTNTTPEPTNNNHNHHTNNKPTKPSVHFSDILTNDNKDSIVPITNDDFLLPNDNNNNDNDDNSDNSDSDSDKIPIEELIIIKDSILTNLLSTSHIFTTSTTILKLLDCLPTAVLTNYYGLSIIYQSEFHGNQLTTLYHTITSLEPIIILIQLASPYDHIVLGGLCSASLTPVNNQSKGQGSLARVFRLNMSTKDEDKVYSWVGIADSECNSECNDDKKAARQHLCIANSQSITFGLSMSHMTSALRLDSDLNMVYTGPSDTYGNPPLLLPHHVMSNGEEKDKEDKESKINTETYSYPIQQIEVICGNLSKQRRDEKNKKQQQ